MTIKIRAKTMQNRTEQHLGHRSEQESSSDALIGSKKEKNIMKEIVPVRLVYSYCHEDRLYLRSIQTALAPLREQGLVEEWLDEKIPPGKLITESVKKKLREADVVVFMISSRFLNSPACMEEWRYTKELEGEDPRKSRVPVLLAPCAWKDVLDEDIKLLPNEATPVSDYSSNDNAWFEVYEGIKAVIEHVRQMFTPKMDFEEWMEKTELLSHEDIKLSEIFVLPTLTSYATQEGSKPQILESRITDVDTLLAGGHTLVHGAEMSGKTALARYLFLHLSGKGDAVLFVDLRASHGSANERTFKTLYEQQFSGDYDLWRRSRQKTAIVDNFGSDSQSRKFIALLKEHFDKVIVFLTSDTFIAYYRDDRALVDFVEVRLGELTNVKQEELIRARLETTARGAVTDGGVDQIEKQVNNVIQRRIVPRYPFYVLSIVQTFESYMPSNLSITSYAHCYHALIVAKLIKAGVDRKDDELNACFNFAEQLAFALYKAGASDDAEVPEGFDFQGFIKKYHRTYLIPTRLLNRLRHREYGIISDEGIFKISYMYYYFLGKYLSGSRTDEERNVVERMCEKSYVRANNLSLLFVIHHATDNRVIDAITSIVSKTLCNIQPASLSEDETSRFNALIGSLSKTVLNDGDVEQERKRQREARDKAEARGLDAKDEKDDAAVHANDWYRMLKNNEILGQVLRSRYGRLTRDEIRKTIEAISEGGLRLVNLILKDEHEIQNLAKFVGARLGTDASHGVFVQLVQFMSFLWTMTNVESIVGCVSSSNIREVLADVVRNKATPAYDLIGYFSELDGAHELNDDIKRSLRKLLNEYRDPFIKAVLSLRTQHYMNTHRSDRRVEQGICDLLGIPPNRWALRQKGNSRTSRRHTKR